MSLTSDIQKAISTAFGAIDGIEANIDYVEPGSGSYNPATGQHNSNNNIHAGILATKIAFESNQINGTTIRATDEQYLILVNRLTASPARGGQIIEGEIKKEIIRCTTDPLNVAYTVHVRN